MNPIRGVAPILAVVLVLGTQAPVLAQTAPTMSLEPDNGYPRDVFHAKYQWIDCGNIAAGTFVLEIFWDGNAGAPIATSPPFDYQGPGACSATVDAEVAADAIAGDHDVIGQLRDTKSGVLAASQIKSTFLVLEKPKPTLTPKPTPTPEPKPTPTPDPKPTPEPTKPDPTDTPGAIVSPTPEASKTPEPSGSLDVTPTAEPDTTAEPPSSAPAPDQTPTPASEIEGEDTPIVEVIVRMAQEVSNVASDLLLGGITDAMVAINHGLDLAPAPWSRGPNLSNSSGEAVDPDTTASGTSVYVVWADSAEGQWDVMFARSVDHGYSFERPVNLSQNAGASQHPKIVADGGRVTVAWDDDTPGLTSIYTMISRDAGMNWYAPVFAGIGSRPVVASSSSQDYVAWAGGLFGSQIFAARVGAQAIQITTNSDLHRNPAIAASASNVSIAWESRRGSWQISYAVSWDGARSWLTNFVPMDGISPTWYGEPRSCFDGGGPTTAVRHALAVDGRKVLVMWEWLSTFHEINYALSLSDGREWTPPDHDRGPCQDEWLYDSGARPISYGWEVYMDAWAPALATKDGVTCLVYQRPYFAPGPTWRTTLARTCQAGNNAVDVVWFRNAPRGDMDHPTVSFAGDRPVFAWQERDTGATPFDVWLKVLGASVQNISASGGDSTVPHLASSGTNVTAVWTEATSGNRQVYFRTVAAR